MRNIINRTTKIIGSVGSKAEKDDAYIQTYNMAVKSNAELKKNQLELMNKMSNDGFIKEGKDKNDNATYVAQDVIKDMSNEEKTQLIGQINSRTSNLKATLAGAKSDQISNALGDLAFNTKSIRTGQEVASIDTYSSLALGGGETNNRKIFFAQQLEQITKQAASSLIIGGVTKMPGGKPPMPPSITNVTNVTNVTQTVPRNISGRF